MAFLGAGVARLFHPSVTGMLVWHVGTRLHAAHRQSVADRLITWIACAPSTSSLLCRSACCPVAAAADWLAPSAWLVWRFVSTRLHCGVMSRCSCGKALPKQPCMVASCTGRDRVLLSGSLDRHLSMPCSESATQHPRSDYFRILAMRKSCRWTQVGPPTETCS